MSNPSNLTPQTPGEAPAVDNDRVAGIAQGTVDDVLEQLGALSLEELKHLDAVEKQGKDRSTLRGAIAREIESRDDVGTPLPDPKVHNLGDKTNYAAMRDKDVDPTKIDRPVLTLDGWVVPKQREGA